MWRSWRTRYRTLVLLKPLEIEVFMTVEKLMLIISLNWLPIFGKDIISASLLIILNFGNIWQGIITLHIACSKVTVMHRNSIHLDGHIQMVKANFILFKLRILPRNRILKLLTMSSELEWLIVWLIDKRVGAIYVWLRIISRNGDVIAYQSTVC